MTSNGTNGTNGTNGPHISPFDPNSYPPFPDDIPSVKLETYSYAQLEKGNPELETRLFQTCKERGFFYLDLNNSSVSSMGADSEDIGKLATDVFKLPQEEKDKYPTRDSLFGYASPSPHKTQSHFPN